MKVRGTIIFMMSVFSTYGLTICGKIGANSFDEACHNGAGARVVFRILNDVGCPVAGAKVNALFDMADRGEGRRVIGITDTNGVCVVEEKTVGVVKVEVSCEGYYRTKEELCFITMGHEHEVENGKWQPWGMTKEIVLRPIRAPVALKRESNWRRTTVLNEWIGFDLEKCDFIAPVGHGNVCDLEVKFDWDGMFGTKHNGMAVSLKFPQKFSGGYYASRCGWSTFTGVYAANPDKVYSQFFQYYRRPIRDSKGRMIGVDGEGFDQSKVLVVRSRCVVDEQGNLISARYFELERFEFSCNQKKTASLAYDLIYNPTPNDTNLEPK